MHADSRVSQARIHGTSWCLEQTPRMVGECVAKHPFHVEAVQSNNLRWMSCDHAIKEDRLPRNGEGAVHT